MSKELNPEHAEVARTAWEKIHEHIMLRVGNVVIGAASLLDVLETEEEKYEPDNSQER